MNFMIVVSKWTVNHNHDFLRENHGDPYLTADWWLTLSDRFGEPENDRERNRFYEHTGWGFWNWPMRNHKINHLFNNPH